MTTLEEAIKRNDIERVKDLIFEGAADCGGRDPLVLCILEDRLEIAEFLIQAGAETRFPRGDGKTPLEHAVSVGNLPMIRLLVNESGDLISGALILAIKKNDPEIVRELIKRGPDVNAPNRRGKVPVISAVNKDNLEIVKLLFENGADLNVVDAEGNTPLIRCVMRDSENCDVLNFLVDNGSDMHFVNGEGETALMKSVRVMNFPAMRYLIANKVDLNVKNANNETALSLAVSNVDLNTFKLLLAAGADPELASDAIEAMGRENPDLDAYMLKFQETKSVVKTQQSVKNPQQDVKNPQQDVKNPQQDVKNPQLKDSTGGFRFLGFDLTTLVFTFIIFCIGEIIMSSVHSKK